MKKSILPPLFLAGLFCLLSGCASTSAHPRDPLEPMNRAIYKFNDKADRWVIKPVATGYRDYTPDLLQVGVDNFFSNLEDANSAVNHALQGHPKASLYNLSRFLLNSTVGLLGLFDLLGGENRAHDQTDFGETLARWGWKNSMYLVIPLRGPSTLRDGLGLVGDISFRENTLYSNPHDDAKLASNMLDGINTRANLLGVEDTISEAALDPYVYTRDAWLQVRAKKTGDSLPEEEEDDFNIDDLVY
jgi:phospholipid-binding lipoprotein MlaA